MIEMKLSHPLEYGEKKIEALQFDFEKLGGEDIIDAEMKVTKNGLQPATYIEGYAPFIIEVAAKAAGVESVILKDLTAKDFFKVKGLARNFINASLVSAAAQS